MKINETTFCAAPWFQVRQNMDGSFKSCCLIQHELSDYTENKNFFSINDWLYSDYLKYLKENLDNGEFLKECSACWNKEQVDLTSLRQTINNTVAENQPFNQSWMYFYFKNKKNLDHDLLISVDIKTSNICNFSCAMCKPNDSSKIHSLWQKSKDHPLVKEILTQNQNYFEEIDLIYKDGKSYELIQEVLKWKPKHLKLLGGEPLLDAMLLRILDDYNFKSSTNLIFVTNGSVDLTKIANRFKDFRTVSFVVSLEGVSHVQDYVRRGSDWKNIELNLTNYLKFFGHKNLYIHHTLQCLTFYHLPELINWTKKHNISMSVEVLKNPEYLSLNAMPPLLFNLICEQANVIDLQIQAIAQDESSETLNMSKMINLLKQSYNYNKDATKKLKMFLDWYDPNKKWKHILPEWLPYLD